MFIVHPTEITVAPDGSVIHNSEQVNDLILGNVSLPSLKPPNVMCANSGCQPTANNYSCVNNGC